MPGLDARGRLALGLGVAGILGAGFALARGRQLQHQMQVEGVPATQEWTLAMRDARRPDDLAIAALCFALAGVALIAWAFVRRSRS